MLVSVGGGGFQKSNWNGFFEIAVLGATIEVFVSASVGQVIILLCFSHFNTWFFGFYCWTKGS